MDLCNLSVSSPISDLKFDAQEFLRDVEWKVFETNPRINQNYMFQDDINKHLRVSSNSHPYYKHPILDRIRNRLMGWIATKEFVTPRGNLSPQEQR